VIPHDLSVYLCLIIATLGFAFTFGAGNPVSFYRFSSFAFAPMLCFTFWLLAKSKFTHIAPPSSAFLIIILAMSVSYSRYEKSHLVKTAEYTKAFATGDFSIDDAYSHQLALPADGKAQGVIHPAARAAYNIVGRGTRIWAFSLYNYCLLPDCGVETRISFRMTKRPLDVFFNNAERAKLTLQAEGLNYFLITNSLEISDSLTRTDLFSPNNISKHLQVVWTDGDSVLLTWPGNNTKPISKEWLKSYQKAANESPTTAAFPLKEIGNKLYEMDKNRSR